MNRHARRRIHYRHNRRHRFVGHYPFYHRKYIFFSLGGYWPVDYLYRRYYWYGYHPYYWYGRSPRLYMAGSGGDYYTYERYGVYDDFSDVGAGLYDAGSELPDDVTLADIYFQDGVNAFERGQYALAAEKFGLCLEIEPDDIILPFVYAQALFADGQYLPAVDVIRKALVNLPADQPTVFYPRGLYADETTLESQIERLRLTLSQRPDDYDLSLLSGYHLLGVDRASEARTYLARAALDRHNEHAAGVLIDLLDERWK
jgi:tetratricopeptide (TPR) repeat protein